MKTLVVGGGIGGLATAIALGRAGHEVTLLEREAQFSPVGAGIILAPNATHALGTLEVDLASRGQALTRMDVVRANGGLLQRLEVGRFAERFGPVWAMSRPELHEALLAAMPASVQVRTGARLEALEEQPTSVEVHWTRSDEATRERFDVVIGADGIHSRTRRWIHGELPLRYSGVTCWRGIVEGYELDRAIEAWGGRSRVGIVPLRGGRVYYFLVRTAERRAPSPAKEGLHAMFSGFEGEVGRFLERLAGEPGPTLHHDLEELDAPVLGRGRVLLVGDAAHAMTPNQGQGAAMAIEDALAITKALARGPEGALARYVAARQDRVRKVQLDSRRFGDLAHWEGTFARWLRDGLLRMVPGAIGEAHYRALIEPGVALAQDGGAAS